MHYLGLSGQPICSIQENGWERERQTLYESNYRRCMSFMKHGFVGFRGIYQEKIQHIFGQYKSFQDYLVHSFHFSNFYFLFRPFSCSFQSKVYFLFILVYVCSTFCSFLSILVNFCPHSVYFLPFYIHFCPIFFIFSPPFVHFESIFVFFFAQQQSFAVFSVIFSWSQFRKFQLSSCENC